MPYRIEFSVSARATCARKTCKDDKVKIAKGELRFGSWVETSQFQSWSWRHWGCVTPKQLANLAAEVGGDFSQLDGFDELDSEAQEKIKKAVEVGHVAEEDVTPEIEEKKAAAEAASEALKAAKEVEKEAKKEAKKAEKEAAKEAKRAEKEAEREAKLVEKEAKKEAKKAEKEAKVEVKKKAKEAEKDIKKTEKLTNGQEAKGNPATEKASGKKSGKERSQKASKAKAKGDVDADVESKPPKGKKRTLKADKDDQQQEEVVPPAKKAKKAQPSTISGTDGAVDHTKPKKAIKSKSVSNIASNDTHHPIRRSSRNKK